ncbi:nitrogen regulation protein NR(II) [Bacillus sp. 03113]|uniref:two-component system sensor histidine kinase NtrB n=1 Tax=Bacillus sp. 03113 TaxID=2578211 RepID=UPI0011430A6E|nr:HAMP domain-containing sensor histidine kinase [Bacillus sp. 03113]
MNPLFKTKWFTRRKKKIHEIKKENDLTESMDFLNETDMKSTNEGYLAGIGRMAAFFAHEIRNPLTTIIGFAQVLEKNPIIKADPSIAHYASIIREEADKMEYLIQELLSLSKSHLNQDHLSIIDVKQSIEKIITINEMKTSQTSIQFKANLEMETYVTGNAHRFERLMINLIKNAIEAIGTTGTIFINVIKHKKEVEISIIDDGPGIPPEQLEQIFYPFYTTKDEGTGIGLPICKTIVETLNGTLDVQNHPNMGAKVTITLPQSRNTSFNKNK